MVKSLVYSLFDITIHKIPIEGFFIWPTLCNISGSVIDIFHAKICNGDFTIRI